MGCLFSKGNAVDVAPSVQQVAPSVQQVAPSVQQVEHSDDPAPTSNTSTENQPQQQLRIPRGNIAKYSKWLKRFHRLPQQATEGSLVDSQVFLLQDGVAAHDLTPWRDEDTRIVCTRVKENTEPYFWDFSDGAQRVADQTFQQSLTPWRSGDTFWGTTAGYDPFQTHFSPLGGDVIPLNAESVAEYFQNSLKHPPGRCFFCIQGYEMRFELPADGYAWPTLPVNAIADDAATYEQEEIMKRRAARTDMNDPERMRNRRIELIRRMLKKYYNNSEGDLEYQEENELYPWLGWADRMEESWQKFQGLLTVNSNGNKNAEKDIEALTRTQTIIK